MYVDCCMLYRLSDSGQTVWMYCLANIRTNIRQYNIHTDVKYYYTTIRIIIPDNT